MEFKAQSIADFLNGTIEGNPEVTVTNVSKIEDGKPGTLAFLSNPKYTPYIYTTNASVVLVSRSFVPEKPVGATLIRVEDPYRAFASLLDLYLQAKGTKSGIEQPCYIDSTATFEEGIYIGAFAYLGKNVTLGKNVKVYPHVYIGDNVVVKDNCILYSGVKIYEDCRIGEGCILHAGAVIGSDGFGFAPQPDGSYQKIPQVGNVVLEDFVEIGANTTIDCATMGSTIIRKGVKIDNLIQIAHNCEIGENTVMAALTGLAGSTKVGKNCVFAGQVGVAGHLNIGDNVTIGAMSGVSNSIKSNKTVMGAPAMDSMQAAKVYVVYRNLPQLREQVLDMKKEIKAIQTRLEQ